MKKYTAAAFSLLFVICLLATPILADDMDAAESKVFKKVWDKFSKVSNEAIELATSSDRNSRSALEFITAREPRYIRLLKKAQEILGDSEINKYFEEIDELSLKNKELEKDSLAYKRERVSAPETSYNPFVKSRSTLDRKIAEIPNKIRENKKSIENIQNTIIDLLQKKGLHVSKEELQYFIVSAEGSELVRLMNIAENMKRMQRIIENELKADKKNVQLAKYYTGMYLISLESFSVAHDIALEKIAVYRERVGKIIAEANENYRQAKALQRTASESDIQTLEENARINTEVMRVGDLYLSLLQKRSKQLARSKESLTGKIQLAMNTYKTIVNSSSLLSLVRESSSEFSLLLNFEMPELKVLYKSAVLGAFADIADRIRSDL
ncbi:MAG: hypothetical protein IJU76_07545 [Desulfovibrionaceae bacterium]|nr:hypothetical protein [Desulfovibrionaceae bacterium]